MRRDERKGSGAEEAPESQEPPQVELLIDGVLDLHTFSPAEVKDLVGDYLDECAARGITAVRIIHGKGRGHLRRIVHGVLSRHGLVASYRLADEAAGGWGATLVTLRLAAR